MDRVIVKLFPLVVLTLLGAVGCATSSSGVPQGAGVTRLFANVRGIT